MYMFGNMLNQIECAHLAAWPTGSRYICNPPITTTDVDFVLFVEDIQAAYKQLRETSWKIGGEDNKTYGEPEVNGWFSAKKKINEALVNYIVVSDQDQFSKWVTATELAKKLNLLKKEDRIALFEVVVKGEKLY